MAVRNSRNPADLEAYVQEFPDGRFARLARLKIGQLRTAAVDLSPARPSLPQAAIQTPSGGDIFRDPTTGMEFVFVQGGEYEQGCGYWTSGCEDHEKPVRRVRLSPFWLGKHEVTLAQFKRFTIETNYRTDAEKDGSCWIHDAEAEKKAGASFRAPGIIQSNRHPVVCVSWNDARAFAHWLSGRSSHTYRLPTEAEWEYACRDGGRPIEYAWGNDSPTREIPGAGNVADESARRRFSAWSIMTGYDDGYVFTAAVGSYAANGIGLHDMTGNVWEWVEDVYSDSAYASGQGSTDPSHGQIVYRN